MTICQRKCKKSRNVTEIKKSIAREDSSASSRFYRLPQGDTSDKKKTEELWRFDQTFM